MGELNDLQQLWSSLQGKAAGGRIDYNPAMATMCVAACGKMLGRLMAAQSYITAPPQGPPIDNLPEFGNLPSGISMAGAFNLRATALSSILTAHQAIVTDMGEAYALAGKLYTSTELESRALFADVKPAEFAGKPEYAVLEQPNYVATYSSSVSQTLPTGAEAILTGYMPVYPVEPAVTDGLDNLVTPAEASDSLRYEQLYQLRTQINPQPVSDAGSTWLYLAEKLSISFTEFLDTVGKTQDGWTGVGGPAARAAVGKYTAMSEPLLTKMNRIGNNLVKTAVWLNTTKHSMPDTPTNPASVSPALHPGLGTMMTPGPDPTLQYRKNYEGSYLTGFPQSRNEIPPLDPPEPIVSPTETTKTGTGAGTGTGYTGNSRGPTGLDTPGISMPMLPTTDIPTPPIGIVEPDNLPQLPTATTPAGTSDSTGTPDLGRLGNAAQQALSGAQQAAAMHPVPTAPNVAKIASPAKAGRAGSGARAGGGAGAGAVKGTTVAKEASQAKLFPRASAVPTGSAAAAAGRTGAGPAGGTPGAPGGAGQRSQGKEHKRADYLNSKQHLEDTVKDSTGIKPVLDQ